MRNAFLFWSSHTRDIRHKRLSIFRDIVARRCARVCHDVLKNWWQTTRATNSDHDNKLVADVLRERQVCICVCVYVCVCVCVCPCVYYLQRQVTAERVCVCVCACSLLREQTSCPVMTLLDPCVCVCVCVCVSVCETRVYALRRVLLCFATSWCDLIGTMKGWRTS